MFDKGQKQSSTLSCDSSYFDWLLGPQKGQIFKKKSLKIFSETLCFMKLILCIHVPGISLYKNAANLRCNATYHCFFVCSSQIRTLVAMATFSFHRLIMGKVQIVYFCSLIFIFLRNVY